MSTEGSCLCTEVATDTSECGMGTMRGMWEIVSQLLDGEKLPESVNAAIYALCEGTARVIRTEDDSATPHQGEARHQGRDPMGDNS